MGMADMFLKLALLLCCLTVPCAAQAIELRIVLFDVSPYASVGSDGKTPEGIYVDLVKRLVQSAGHTARFEIVPFARVSVLLETEQADLTIGFSTSRLEQVAVPLASIRTVSSVVLLGKGKSANRAEDLAALEIGRLRGGCKDLFDDKKVAVVPNEINGMGSGVRMLAAGRIHGLCATQDAIEYVMTQERLDRSLFGNWLKLSEREAFLHAGKHVPGEVRESLQRAVARLRKEGRL